MPTPPAAFMECSICRAKPGSPTLCVSCYHNRNLICQLQAKVIMLDGKLTESQRYIGLFACVVAAGIAAALLKWL